jgi:Phosphodiester glycosidase
MNMLLSDCFCPRITLTITLILIGAASECIAQTAKFDWEQTVEVLPGVRLISQLETEPRPMRVHCARVDLQTPGLKLDTTGRTGDWTVNNVETMRQTTRDFIRSSQKGDRKIRLAINADAFSPWPAPWNQSTPTNLQGLAICNGSVVSPGNGTPSFLIDSENSASIQVTTPETPTTNIRTAVSGFGLCLTDGVPQPSGTDLHPRTGLGLSQDGRYLSLMIIDGRRKSSQGATTQELGELLRRSGADDGINMDGGGSSTLAWWNEKSPEPEKCELINAPVGNGLRFESPAAEELFQPSERANGNNLGIYYSVAP